MKFLGAGLVWLSLSLLGITLSSRLKKRSEVFQSILIMIDSFSSKINYMMKPVDELIFDFQKEGRCDNLTFISLCAEFLDGGNDFPIAWIKAIDSSELPLKKDEISKLCSLGLSIGKSDVEGQNAVLKMYYAFFQSFSRKAEEEREKYSSMTFITCFLCGCALFILLI